MASPCANAPTALRPSTVSDLDTNSGATITVDDQLSRPAWAHAVEWLCIFWSWLSARLPVIVVLAILFERRGRIRRSTVAKRALNSLTHAPQGHADKGDSGYGFSGLCFAVVVFSTCGSCLIPSCANGCAHSIGESDKTADTLVSQQARGRSSIG